MCILTQNSGLFILRESIEPWLKLLSNIKYQLCVFDYYLSDCPSFVHGIGICSAQHCQAMFEHGVYKLACIPKYFIKSSTETSFMIDIA